MNINLSIEINAPISDVWSAICNIRESAKMITNILNIEILAEPDSTIVGLRWKETRKMFGKEAAEIMWITEADAPNYYIVRSENHGAIFDSRMGIEECEGRSILSMSFTSQATTLGAKILASVMSFFIKTSMEKELNKDLKDIKHFVEQRQVAQ